MPPSKSPRRVKPPASPSEPAQAQAPAQAPAPSITTPAPTKLDRVVALLRRPQGATLAELQAATGWQPHSVRGALAGAVKKRLTLPITSTKEARGRVYRIGAEHQS